MADIPSKRPDDPGKEQGMRGNEDSFYDVLLWTLRLTCITLIILTIINVAILSKAQDPLRGVRKLRRIYSVSQQLQNNMTDGRSAHE